MNRAADVTIYAPSSASFYAAGAPVAVGGAEVQTTLMAHELAARGLRTAHIVYPVGQRKVLGPNTPHLVERAAYNGQGRLGPLVEARSIWQALAQADSSVYIVRGSGGHLVPAAAFCRARRRRLIFSASNDLDFDLNRPDRAQRILRIYGRAVRAADRVVVQTGQQLDLARAAFPGLEPILIPSFSQVSDAEPQEPEYFLWADRMVRYKRPERFVDLAEALPDVPFRMVAPTTSETEPGLDEEIRGRAARLPNLDFVEPRPREQLMEEMTRAAAVVATSRFEGMPNTFLEAWARGIPVLSLSVDPDARIADHGTGILAEDDMDRFVAGARDLWADPDLRRRMGDQARRFVRDTHSPEAVGDRWAETVRDLLAEHG